MTTSVATGSEQQGHELQSAAENKKRSAKIADPFAARRLATEGASRNPVAKHETPADQAEDYPCQNHQAEVRGKSPLA